MTAESTMHAMSRKLSTDKIERARKMRELNWSWRQIAAYLDVGPDTVRSALDPAHRLKVETWRKNSEQVRRALRAQPKARRVRVKPNLSIDPDQLTPSVFLSAQISIPDRVLVDRERRAQLSPASITAALFGDPLPGRSALDQRKPRLVVTNLAPANVAGGVMCIEPGTWPGKMVDATGKSRLGDAND